MIIQQKYSPYLFIAVLALTGSVTAWFMIRDFPWYMYVIGFVGRFTFMSAQWQVIRLVNRWLGKRFTLEARPVTQIVLQVLFTLGLLSPVFFISYWSLQTYLPAFLVDTRIIPLIIALYFLVVMMMTFGYYTYDLFIKHKEALEEKTRLRLEAAQLEKEKSLMQFHHLRNQVNPHFLFNTLSSLDALVHSDPELASEFIRHLAKVYRYVLEHKEREVVSLETELNFIRHYTSLLEIRYKESVRFCFVLSKEALDKGIVMVTLQMLIDNALKHNSIQTSNPLEIRIWDEGDQLHIRNNKQDRKQIAPSNQQGLRQLRDLYAWLSLVPMEVRDETDSFEVILPLL